jgi:hypothetical protein
VQSLVDHFGPITLGYLEAIIRSSDGRASDDRTSPGRDPDPLLSGIKLTVATNTGVVAHDAPANQIEQEPANV